MKKDVKSKSEKLAELTQLPDTNQKKQKALQICGTLNKIYDGLTLNLDASVRALEAAKGKLGNNPTLIEGINNQIESLRVTHSNRPKLENVLATFDKLGILEEIVISGINMVFARVYADAMQVKG